MPLDAFEVGGRVCWDKRDQDIVANPWHKPSYIGPNCVPAELLEQTIKSISTARCMTVFRFKCQYAAVCCLGSLGLWDSCRTVTAT